MKRLFATILCLNFWISPALAVVEDVFVQNTLDGSLKINVPSKPLVQDEFVLETLDKNLKINRKTPVIIAAKELINLQNFGSKKIVPQKTEIKDDFLPKITADEAFSRINKKKTSGRKEIPVQIKIRKPFSTKNPPEEGEDIEFLTVSDIVYKGKVIPKDTVVKGRIETVSMNKTMGVPAELVLGNFSLNGNELDGELEFAGANRCLWVYPLVYTTSMFFYAGLIFVPIRGGHVKISPKQIFTLYL